MGEKGIDFIKSWQSSQGVSVGPYIIDPVFLRTIVFEDRANGKLYEVYVEGGEMKIQEVAQP